MLKQFSRFLADDTGANALEYALVLSLVAMGVAVGAGALGTSLGTMFTNLGKTVSGYKTS